MRAGVGERQRFHLFEAGAFVTQVFSTDLRPQRFSVSTYLKLELLSQVHYWVTWPPELTAFPPI